MKEKITFKAKLGYGMGDFAFNLTYQSLTFFLLFFYTDYFKIPSAWAGIVFILAKLWDAVSDPLMGFIVDRTKTRWGSKRPYLLFGAIPFGISFALLFLGPELGDAAKIVYALATYIIFCTAITVVNIPYGSLTAAMTTDSQERVRISTVRMIFSVLATLIAAGGTKTIADILGGGLDGFRKVGMIYGTLSAIIVLITFFSTRENVQPDPADRIRLSDIAKVVLPNKPFLVLAISNIILMIALNMVAGAVPYFFKYTIGQDGGESVALAILFVIAIAVMPVLGKLSGRIGKRDAYSIALIVFIAMLLLIGHSPTDNFPLLMVYFALTGIGVSAFYLSPWSMVPDTIEYAQWKSGLRREGIIYGLFFFTFKLGSALAGFTIGIVLSLSGYIADAAASPDVILGIRFILCYLPVAFAIIGLLILRLYSIDHKEHARILAELKKD